MAFYKIFNLNPGVKLTLNWIYGGGTKDVKIEMSEAQTQNWEKEKERKGREDRTILHVLQSLYFWNKKENNTYCFDGIFFRRKKNFIFPEMQDKLM